MGGIDKDLDIDGKAPIEKVVGKVEKWELGM